VLAANGDSYGSHVSATGDIGNPGINLVTPEPASAVIAITAIAPLGRRRRS
jgi:hypothetical protein